MPLLQEEPGHVVSKCFKKKFDEKSSKANRGEDIERLWLLMKVRNGTERSGTLTVEPAST